MTNDPSRASATATAPKVLWRPSESWKRESIFVEYLEWLARELGVRLSTYPEVWEWSTTELEAFWESVWEFSGVISHSRYEAVLVDRRMPGARWFPGATLNYAEHVFRHADPTRPALVFASEAGAAGEVGWDELARQVASVAAALREMGVERGDRVAAFMPNVPATAIAFLATVSLGAIWSACSPDFGAPSAIERFRQIEPKVLFAVDGYQYGGRAYDRIEVVAELRKALPCLRETVLVPQLDSSVRIPGGRLWADLLVHETPLVFDPVAFDHPLWILYSSGTTGTPKAIVHGHGGILLEHLKSLRIQANMPPGDRMLWATTSGWMMWNVLVGSLLAGVTPVLYDGSVGHPDLAVLWRLVEEFRVTRFGASPAFFEVCRKAGMRPGAEFDLTCLKGIGASGSPLPPETYAYIYEAVGRDLWLSSSSGGTDVAAGFVGGCPTMPLYEGEMQGALLGVRAAAFDEAGRPVIDEVGELVITEPMPSMPLYFWNDPGDVRYSETYFDTYPGVWRHGDRIRFTPRGGAIIYGRSDATLNRFGVRIGTSEVYRAVEGLPEIVDSLVVGVELPGGGYYMPLFIVPAEGIVVDDALRETIRRQIRTTFTPRHLPDEIIEAPAVARTLSGKKLEVPIKRMLMGEPMDRVVNFGSLANPEALEFYARFAAVRGQRMVPAAPRPGIT